MKKFYLCIIFTLPILAFAQSPCDNNNVFLETQADVDNFPSQYCNTLCSLTITGNDITNLDSLYVLEKVGSLVIQFNPMLNDIGGLSNLVSIEGSCGYAGLNISSNNLLSDLSGLASLTRIDGPFTIGSNTMLHDLTDLSNLAEIDELTITNNASLENLNGLESVTTLGNSLTISGNPGLQNIDALSNVTSIKGGLSIRYNDALTDLDGLASLTHVEYGVIISGNADLANIQGLSMLNHIGQLSISGASLEISFNDVLTSLDGLQGLDTIPGTAAIEGNESLLNLDGLSSVKTFAIPVGSSYNSGINIENNNSLVSVAGLGGVAVINAGRASYLDIKSNPVLQSIDLPNLVSVEGNLGGRIMITGNAALKNLDGLSGLQKITGGMSAVFEISNNASLENIDGLSSFSKLSVSRALTITSNTTLGRFCGLYNLFHSKGIGCGSPECYSTAQVLISGNERNPTPEEIEAEGPCDVLQSQPTNLVFSNVTSEGMRVKFNRSATFSSGYIVLMQSYEPAAPAAVPQDGTTYRVGQVINGSAIVVHAGTDTTFVVSGLMPSTPYYFDVFAWKVTENGNDYLTVSPLEGSQSTSGSTQSVSNLSFTDVTDESMTVAMQDPEEGSYITLMQAFGSPSPNDVPVDGTEYHVGGTVGSSTIIVNIGDGSEFTVNGLMPNVKYYFDIYRYDPATFTYQSNPGHGSQTTAPSGEDLRAYPNPFDVATTIPFVVSRGHGNVQVAIYDTMGAEVSVLAAGSFDAGKHEASWDGYDKNGRKMAAGVYIYSVKCDTGVVTGRVSLR